MRVRYLVLFGLFIVLAVPCAQAKKPAVVAPTLDEILATAKAEGKLVFIQLGRETCGNCQALRGYIAQGAVRLPKDRFVYADLNCDDPETNRAFYKLFQVQGNMLPFVVIADSNGKQIASRAGFGSADEFTKFVHDAERKAPKPEKTDTKAAKNTLKKPAGPAVIAHDENREMRTWTAATSRQQIKAALVEEAGGALVLKKEDGAKVSILPAYLTREDQDYVEQVRHPPVPPATNDVVAAQSRQ